MFLCYYLENYEKIELLSNFYYYTINIDKEFMELTVHVSKT